MIHRKIAVALVALGVMVWGGQLAQAAPVVLAVGESEGAPGKEVVVTISLKGVKQAKGVRGMNGRLNYDPAVLTFKSIEEGPLLSRAIVRKDIDETADPGKLAFGFLCDTVTLTSQEFTSVQEDGVVLKVIFVVNDNAKAGQKSPLKLDNFRVIGTSVPPYEMPARSEDGAVAIVAPALAIPWMWIIIGIGALLFLLLLIALLSRRKKDEPAPADVPSFAPDAATMFAHTCVQCGGVIQLPRAMMGQVFKCSACAKTQTAGPGRG